MRPAAPLKYRSLTQLLDALAAPLAAGRLALAAQWRDNEEALGLIHPDDPRHAAFVFTFGQAPGRFGVDLAFPALADIAAAGVPLVQEGLGLDQVLEVLRTHFDLAGRGAHAPPPPAAPRPRGLPSRTAWRDHAAGGGPTPARPAALNPHRDRRRPLRDPGALPARRTQ